MKKFYLMMLMVASMVSVLTGCKKDDDITTASMMVGSYTDKMKYSYTTSETPITPIESRSVTVNVIEADADHVNIEIPEIKNLAFQARYKGTTIDVNVENYSNFTITNVPVVEADGLFIASKLTKATFDKSMKISDIISKYPFDFEVRDVTHKMTVGDRDLPGGKAVVSGQIIALKADNKLTVIYEFYPAEALKGMGISIGGIMGLDINLY